LDETGSGSEEVVHMDTSKDDAVFGLPKVETILALDPSKPKGDHLLVHLLIPYAIALWKTIEASHQFPDLIFPALFLEALRLLHIYFFARFKFALKESRFDVKLV
jgi:hypothetical protein